MDVYLLDMHTQFDRMVGAVMDLNDLYIFTRFVIIIWGVWKFRNLRIFQHSEVFVSDVVRNYFSYVKSYLLAR